MKRNKIAIIANGEPVNKQLLKNILSDIDIIIAADGGANNCKQAEITPDYIIGDMDSVAPEIQATFPNTKFVSRPDQNFTDMQKAIKFALSLNPTQIKILSAFGHRTDHTLGNLLILQEYNELIPLEIYDNYGKMTSLSAGKHELKGIPGKTVSLFSLEPISSLTLTGFKYQLHKANFESNFIGVSNIYNNENCCIEFNSGKLFLYELF